MTPSLKTPVYGGTKRSSSGQTQRVLLASDQSFQPLLFITYEHLQKTHFSLSAQFKNNLWVQIYIKCCSCSSISRVIPDDVTYCILVTKSVFSTLGRKWFTVNTLLRIIKLTKFPVPSFKFQVLFHINYRVPLHAGNIC